MVRIKTNCPAAEAVSQPLPFRLSMYNYALCEETDRFAEVFMLIYAIVMHVQICLTFLYVFNEMATLDQLV